MRGEQSIDERAFRELTEESADLHSDAMRDTKAGLNDYVEAVQESRIARGVGAGAIGAGIVGAGILATAGSAFADDTDVQALQTAASLENLAVFTYKTALTLDFIGGASANGVVKAFSQMTMKQHGEHADAFNAAAVKLGGKKQTETNPKYTPIVQKAVPTIKGPADVVGLAITLETVATQTYVKNVGQVSTAELRQLFASVAGVEAQHQTTLLAVQALLKGGAPQLIALPPDLAKLPKAAGSVGFPNAFFPITMASPVAEGAVK